MRNKKIIVLAFPGSGKSYLIKKYKNVIDNDFCYFKFLYDKPAREMTEEELESKKGNKAIETPNPAYPDNLIKSTLEEVKNNIVLIPLSMGTYKIFKELYANKQLNDIDVFMIYPAKEEFSSFITRYKTRGNSDVFMKYNHISQFDEWVRIFDQEKDFSTTHIGSDQYLEQVLKNLNIKLIKKYKTEL